MKIAAFILSVSLFVSPLLADTFVYVSESKDQRIAVFSFDQANGDLKRVGETNVDGAVGCLALSADQKFLHAAVRGNHEFATLSVDKKTGLLTPVSKAKAAGSAAYIWPDQTGKWLLAAYYGEGLASVSKIENGVVSGEPVQVEDIGRKAHCVQTSPDNRFAFVPHPVELNKVTQFRFNAESGRLELNDPPALIAGEGDGPRHLQFHPNGKWLYFVNEQSKSVTFCHYDIEKGTLEAKQTVSTVPSSWDPKEGSCADIEISKDGRFVYASNRGHDSIAIFSIDPETGEITSLGQEPTEHIPRSFNLIPGGENWMVAAGQRSNTLAIYSREKQAGTLKRVATMECGASPAWVLGVQFRD